MLCRLRLVKNVSLCLLTGGWPRHLLSCAIVSQHTASQALLAFMPWRRFVSSVVGRVGGPHNVATEPLDAYSTHGRSLSANCPHREGTHSIFKLQADACAGRSTLLLNVVIVPLDGYAYVPHPEPYNRDVNAIVKLGGGGLGTVVCCFIRT